MSESSGPMPIKLSAVSEGALETVGATLSDSAISPRTETARSVSGYDAFLNRYEILSEAGRGAMGVVYKARHRLLGNQCALKISTPGSAPERYIREARVMAQIDSPFVVTVRECGMMHDNRVAMVMDWIDGEDLGKTLLREGIIEEARARRWMLEAARGLATASNQGIVHRDVKPSNIMIDDCGRARVADFGLARDMEDIGASVSSGLLGTPLYMAPEQAENPRTVDPRSDIYSLGATFYHVLTGQPPFVGSSAFAVLFKHKMEPLISIKKLNPKVSSHLAEIVERCLAKSMNERFGGFDELVKVLEQSQPIQTDADPVVARILEDYCAWRERFLSDTSVREFVLDCGSGRLIKIRRGDICSVGVEALVSSDDELLTMTAGVSYAIKQAAGANWLEEMARQFTPVLVGRVLVTPAGPKLATKGVRFVFHGVTIAFRDGVRILPSRNIIAEILEGVFHHADTFGLSSFAVPLLGTGNGGFSPDECLDITVHYLAKSLVRGLTTVREAHVVVYA